MAWSTDIKAELAELTSALTQAFNALCGGGRNLSFSARSAELAAAGHWYGRARVNVVNLLFWPLEGWGHCERNLAWYRAQSPHSAATATD